MIIGITLATLFLISIGIWAYRSFKEAGFVKDKKNGEEKDE